ncbi:uncharacterized protein LOC129747514 [Uranotaenia lowii]|uniref:uncharacterized protein LOC129747514 n=1 Tax=Uranotaenia lowii TaxID=190385 RepID=UPI002478BD0A|nr:uncharacterized protein LOC129747514 [Uranotaenia lowii]
MASLVVVCVQLMLACCCCWGGTSVAIPLGQPALVGTHLQALFSASPVQKSSASATSKRHQQQQPILIEPDNGFAFRRPQPHFLPSMDFNSGIEMASSNSNGGGSGGASHFRSLHDADTHLLNHHRHQPYRHGSPLTMLEPPEMNGNLDYDQFRPTNEGNGMNFPSAARQQHNEDLGLELEEFANEIGDNPLFQQSAPTPSSSSAYQQVISQAILGGNNFQNVESFDLIRERLERIKEEEDIEVKSNLLMRMLEELPEGPLPIVYIEDSSGAASASSISSSSTDGDESSNEDNGEDDSHDDEGANSEGKKATTETEEGQHSEDSQQFKTGGSKRSGRYYRRYPWKRQNSRSRPYDADARYLCVPSREDVFKLLVGLHENRVGNHQRTVNFCNRKRPAKAIFTNIRFLG